MLALLAEKHSAQRANISVPNIVSLQRLTQQDRSVYQLDNDVAIVPQKFNL